MPKAQRTAAAIIEERKWEEEHLARTLAEAESIQADPKKRRMAQRGALRLEKEAMDKAKAMKRIAKKKGK